MHRFRLFLTIFFLGSFVIAAEQPLVLVSISPQKFLVQQIAGDTMSVATIVPPAMSPHTYEPTPMQIIKIKDAIVWFRIGEGFEKRLIKLMGTTKIVDQREGVELIKAACPCHDHESFDPHIWLSPKILRHMSIQIADTLSHKFPQNAFLYQENLNALLAKLDALGKEAEVLLLPIKGKTILVSHPAFAYLCADYGLKQLPIEMEGKEPTPKYLVEIYKIAEKENIKTVFLQRQYNVRGGEKLAKDLHARTVFLDPYKENVIQNILDIAQAFHDGG